MFQKLMDGLAAQLELYFGLIFCQSPKFAVPSRSEWSLNLGASSFHTVSLRGGVQV